VIPPPEGNPVPEFSVVIPLHNKDPHIARALRSVLAQTHGDYEVIVVDDASTDGGVAVVEGFGEPSIRILRRTTPGPGGYAARNLGIAEARGEWVAFLDADDEWFPDHLDQLRLLIARFPGAAVLAAGWEVHNPSGLYGERYADAYSVRNRNREPHVLSFEEYLRAELHGSRPIWTSVACVRRSVLLEAGGFPDGRARRGGDVDTWIRCIAHAGSMAWSPHFGGIYYRDAVNMVTRTEAFTAACERETVEAMLASQGDGTQRLLKQFANRRTIGAWKQSALARADRFTLFGKLSWSVGRRQALFWSLVSALPPSFYRTASAASRAAKRGMPRVRRRLLRSPVADLARAGRTAVLRLLPREPGVPAGAQDDASYLSGGAGATFFGYHDKTPVSGDGRRILAMTAPPGADPLDASGPPLLLGYFPATERGVVTGPFTAFAETVAWCWQQGCMLQWHPLRADRHVVYNTVRDGAYRAVVFDVEEGWPVREYEAPVYALDPGGRRAASLNFSRLERLRPGYGYGRSPDATAGLAAPAEDGLFLVDLKSGAAELGVSLATLASEVAVGDAEHYVNHVSFAPDGARLVFLHLWEYGHRRSGRLCLLDLATGERAVLEPDRTVSHYCWRDERRLLATTRTRAGTWHYTQYNVVTGARRDLDLPLSRDGHPMIRPTDPDRIVTDTYPDRRREQHLLTVDVETGVVEPLARFRSPSRFRGPGRCDLHPRWDPRGRYIVVDTTHRGRREMAVVPWRDRDL
jgi:glycosyltransferase involved in cell wall biosynthesis